MSTVVITRLEPGKWQARCVRCKAVRVFTRWTPAATYRWRHTCPE